MNKTNEPKKKTGVGQIVYWVLGVIIALAGVGQLFSGAVLGGLLMLVGGVLLLPPILSMLESSAHAKRGVIIVVAAVLIVLGAVLSGGNDEAEGAVEDTSGESSAIEESSATEESNVTEESDATGESSTTEDEQESTSSAAAEESIAEEEAEASEVEAEEYVFDAGALSYLNMTRDELLEVYNALDELFLSVDSSEYDSEQWAEYETECAEQVATDYGITADDVTNVYIYGGEENYFATFDVTAVEMTYGETVEVKTVGGTAIVKAKITASYSNEATIDQNYYNVCDFIRDYAGTDFDTISYWAVADMTDGSESKVISFDLTGDIITTIATGDFADNTLGDYVEDLWVLPSLLEED